MDQSLALSPFKDGLQFAWDSTSIKLAETCHRKYQYKIIEGWAPKRTSVHLVFGGLFAKALENYYKYRALGDASNDALCKVVREALIASWDHECKSCLGTGYFSEKEECGSCNGTGKVTGQPIEFDDPVKTRENLIRTIVWYVAEFENESIQVVKTAEGKPAVEYTFALPVDNGLVFCGHIDRLVEYSGDKYVMDQKTTKTTVGPYYFDSFSPDTQMSMYTFAGKMIYNTPVKGVILDAAQIAVGFTRFARGFTFRSEGDLEEWYNNTLRIIEEVHQSTERNYFPMRSTSCGMYGGCEFRHVCSRSPEVRPQFLKGDFDKRKPWNPLEVR
jgi:hypothetical protein